MSARKWIAGALFGLVTAGCGAEPVDEVVGSTSQALGVTPSSQVYVYQANMHRFYDDWVPLITHRMKTAAYKPDVVVLQQVDTAAKVAAFRDQMNAFLGDTSYSYIWNPGLGAPSSKAIIWRADKLRLDTWSNVTSWKLNDAQTGCTQQNNNLAAQFTDKVSGQTLGVASIWTNGELWGIASAAIPVDGCAYKNVQSARDAIASWSTNRIIAGDQNITPDYNGSNRCWYKAVTGGSTSGCTAETGAGSTLAFEDAMVVAGDAVGTASCTASGCAPRRIDFMFENGMTPGTGAASGTLASMDLDGDGLPYSDHAALRALFNY